MSDEPSWVVWSEEHGAWWAPGELGYTSSLHNAGRYSEEAARMIENRANRYLRNGLINEVAMPDPWPKLENGAPSPTHETRL